MCTGTRVTSIRQSRRRAGNRSNRRGSVAVLAAIVLIVTIVFLAYAIDFGYIVVTESELQNAADAGATSGAKALSDGRAAVITAAKAWATKNTAAGKTILVTDEDVEIGRWDDESAAFSVIPANSNQTPNAVRVTCRRTAGHGNPLKLFFAPIVGTKYANLTVSATARTRLSRCGLIIGLAKVTMSGSSHTDSYRSDDGNYSAASPGTNGHVCSNGDITMSGSTAIHGDAHPGLDHVIKSSSSVGPSGSIEPLEKPLAPAPVDPGDAPHHNDNGSIPFSSLGKNPLTSANEFKLSGGDSVDLRPGTYYFSKMTLSGGSTIRISGPTVIYVTGDCSLSGGSLANSTFLPKNLQLYPMGSKCVISGDSEFYGAVYGPTTAVERSGDSDFYGAIVGASLVLSGSGGIHADDSLDLQPFAGGARRSTLVQ